MLLLIILFVAMSGDDSKAKTGTASKTKAPKEEAPKRIAPDVSGLEATGAANRAVSTLCPRPPRGFVRNRERSNGGGSCRGAIGGGDDTGAGATRTVALGCPKTVSHARALPLRS